MGNLDLATITVIIGFAAAIMTIAMGGAIVVTIDDDVCPFFHDPSFLASPGAPALYVLSLCVPLSVCIPSLYIPASCTPHAPSLIAFLLLSLAFLFLRSCILSSYVRRVPPWLVGTSFPLLASLSQQPGDKWRRKP